MPKKKVTKADAKASIKRLHNAAKKKEKPDFKPAPAVQSVREVPAQHQAVVEPAPVEEKKEVVLPVAPEEPKEEPVREEKKSKRFVIGDSIEFGWSAVKKHVWFFVGIFLLFAALSAMSNYATGIGTRFVLSLLVAGISLGYIKLALDITDGKEPEFKELFSCFSLLLKYLVAAVIYFVVVSIGLLLFIVPGVIWAVQFGFYQYIIVKDRLGPVAALRKSSELTSGLKVHLIVFGLALIGINLLGALALGIGLILTIPLSVIAIAHVFKQLSS